MSSWIVGDPEVKDPVSEIIKYGFPVIRPWIGSYLTASTMVASS